MQEHVISCLQSGHTLCLGYISACFILSGWLTRFIFQKNLVIFPAIQLILQILIKRSQLLTLLLLLSLFLCLGSSVLVLLGSQFRVPWATLLGYQQSCFNNSPLSFLQAQRLGHSFKEVLARYGEDELPLKETVAELLMDRTKDDSSMLPGIFPPEVEYHLSSIYIDVSRPQVTLTCSFLN